MKKSLYVVIAFLTMIWLVGCDGKKNNEPLEVETKLYFVDNTSAKLVYEYYQPKATTRRALIREYLAALKNGPEEVLYKKAIPDTVSIKDFSYSEGGIVTLNLDVSYLELSSIQEVLCRATIVKTLSQVEGVDYIEFYVNGQPYLDSNGVLVGLMTADDFISSTSAETNYPVSLYFTDRSGDTLVEADAIINYSGTGTIEELVINQLINGATEIGIYDTIPDETTLLNVTTKEGVCTVDLNEKFLEEVPGVTSEVTIYSVVNSLVELPSIKRVQFLINGETRKTYRDNIPFDGVFERNLSIIKGSK